jgi:predicted RNA-binding protein (virulence factor B family)
MDIQIGTTYQAKVLRKTDIGYMLDIHGEEVFLHYKETTPLIEQQDIDVFIYMDSYDRIAATTKIPIIKKTEKALLEVVDTHPSLGVFVDIGINKHVLLSSDDLPYDRYIWPNIGDFVYVSLEAKKKLFLKISDPKQNDAPLTLPTKVSGHVIKWMHAGIRVFTEDQHVIFIHISQIKDDRPRLGQKVEVHVTFYSEKGYSGTLLPFKEVKRLEDADILLAYLEKHHEMPFDSDTEADVIMQRFNMSKKAFKRALGHLYKLRKIRFEDKKTILIEE